MKSDGGLQRPVLRGNYLILTSVSIGPIRFRDHKMSLQINHMHPLNWDDYYDKDARYFVRTHFINFLIIKFIPYRHISIDSSGVSIGRHLGIKEIDDRTCQGMVNKLPVNDGVRNFDFLFFVFNILIRLVTPVLL